MRLNYYEFPQNVDANTRWHEGAEGLEGFGDTCTKAGWTVEGISVKEVKRLLKTYGGKGWTYHIDRDGTVFDTSEIKLKGNNSKFKYNQHL